MASIRKLDPDDIVRIRWERKLGAPIKELANKYSVSEGHISRIARGESYAGSGGPLVKSPAANTHCVHGHEYTPENIVVKHGRRNCRRCKNDLENARKMKKRADAKAGAARG